MHRDSIIGWGLFILGFFVAAATAMPIPPKWGIFAVALAVAIVGAFLARRAANRHARGGNDGASAQQEALPALRRLDEALRAIDPEDEAEKIKAAIEHLQLELFPPFVAQRRRYLHEHGPVSFAHFFGAFAKAERFVNRCWSALVDDHRPEAVESLRRAHLGLREAIEALEGAGK